MRAGLLDSWRWRQRRVSEAFKVRGASHRDRHSAFVHAKAEWLRGLLSTNRCLAGFAELQRLGVSLLSSRTPRHLRAAPR